MRNPLIQIESISYQYEGQASYALDNVSLDIFEGEWLAIVGHNGSGKSTLAKLLNGLQFPQKGNINVRGVSLSEETVWEIRKQVGMVFQNPDNQFVGSTVQDDVAFALENNGIPREDMVVRVIDSLKSVQMDGFLNQEPHNLSGGQKQRVAIAGVIALRPSVIILDEATSMLDPKGREEVLDLVFDLKNKSNMTVISITHDLEEAARADRIVVMNKGKLYKEGKPEVIFQMDEELIKLGLDIPFPVKLSKALKEMGVDITKPYLSEEELVADLWTSHCKK